MPVNGASTGLELSGRAGPVLHRPKIGAVGCWLLAAGYLLSPLVGVMHVMISVLSQTPPSREGGGFTIVLTISGILRPLFWIFGAALVGMADLARGAVNPWPRRLAVSAVMVMGVLSLGQLTMILLEPSAPSSSSGFDSLPQLDLIVGALKRSLAFGTGMRLVESVACVFMLLYVRQLAGWMRRNFFAGVSFIVFGIAILLFMSDGAIQGVHLAQLCIEPRSVDDWVPRAVRTMVPAAAEMPAAMMLGVYFAVIGWCLGDAAAARRQGAGAG